MVEGVNVMKSIAIPPMIRLLAAATLGAVVLVPFLGAQSAENSSPRQVQSRESAMEAHWRQLQQTVQPEIVIKLSEEFGRAYPNSRYRQANLRLQADARKAFRAQQEARLSSEALDDPAGDATYRIGLIQAMHGDREAAYRVSGMYRQGSHGLAKDPQRSAQWLRIAAELGNGRASWEVANIYNRDGAMADAARFEAKAVRDGFRIPPRMPNRGLEY
jgi:TPR repeat protein